VLRSRQGAQRQRDEARVAAEGLEHLDERMSLLQLRLPVRRDDQRGCRSQPPHDVLEGLDRLLGPVQLLQYQHDRPSLSDPGQGSREKLEERDLVVGFRGVLARLRGRGSELPDLREDGEERDEVRGEIREVRSGRRAASRLLRPEVVLDELAEALVREGAVLLHEPPLEHADLPRTREARELLDEARLADARLAGHDRELTLARDRRMKAPLQLGDLLLASYEGRGRRLRPRDHAARRQHHRARVFVLVELPPIAPKRVGEVSGLLRPLLGVLLKALEEDGLELLAHVHPQSRERLGQLVDDAVEDRLDLTGEWRLAGQALVENGGEGVRVRPPVEGTRRHLLGAEVRNRPDERPCLREAVLGGREGQAEVHDPRSDVPAVLSRGHDVLGLDVAVDDAPRVRVVERLGHLRADVQDVAEPEGAVAQEMPQVRAGEHRHHEEESALVPPEVVDRHDRRVVHLRDDLRLAEKPLLGVRGEVAGRDQLDGHLAVQDRVLRAVDDAHPAAPELPHHLVAIRETCADQDRAF